MITTLVQPDAAILGDNVAEGACVLVRDGFIVGVGDFARDEADRVQRVEGLLLPGLIDLQVNGAGAHGVEEATVNALDAIARQVWAGGAVAFLPTLITASIDVLCVRLAAVAAWIVGRSERDEHADPVGIHLEGPFLEAVGAHDEAWFCDPTPDRVDALLEAAAGQLALVTLAPGRVGAPAAVAQLRAAGVAIALGHASSAAQFDACVESGASLVTHLFNAMGPLHHRAPGLAGRALDEPRLRCSVIADGIHVHPIMLRNAYRCLGSERTVLVTDSVADAGTRDGAVRDAAGQLAGSTLTMAEAACRWLRMVPSAGPVALARVAASNPADLLGRRDCGDLSKGRRAWFTVLRPDGAMVSLRG